MLLSIIMTHPFTLITVLSQLILLTCIYPFTPLGNLAFSKADWAGLNKYLRNTNFAKYISTNNIDSIWTRISDTMLSGCNLFIPKLSPRNPTYLHGLLHHFSTSWTLRRLVISKSYPHQLVCKLKDMEFSLQKRSKRLKLTMNLSCLPTFLMKRDTCSNILNIFPLSIPKFISWGSMQERHPSKCVNYSTTTLIPYLLLICPPSGTSRSTNSCGPNKLIVILWLSGCLVWNHPVRPLQGCRFW